MNLKILIYTLCTLLFISLQATLLDNIRFFGLKPNIIIIFIIIITLLRNTSEGAFIGIFSGLMQDTMSGKIFGLYSLMGLYLAITMGSIHKRLFRENFFIIAIFTLVATFMYEMTVFIINFILTYSNFNIIFALNKIIIPEAIINSIASIFIYIFIKKFNDILEQNRKIRRRY